MEFENVIFMFQISVLEFVLLQSLVQKWKSLNLVILGWNLKKTVVIFEISTLEFV